MRQERVCNSVGHKLRWQQKKTLCLVSNWKITTLRKEKRKSRLTTYSLG